MVAILVAAIAIAFVYIHLAATYPILLIYSAFIMNIILWFVLMGHYLFWYAHMLTAFDMTYTSLKSDIFVF